MPRFIDSSQGEKHSYVRHWLDETLISSARELRIQSAYFTYAGLSEFAEVLAALDLAYFVFSRSVAAADLECLCDAILDVPDKSLTVVRFSDGFFHPKCFHVVRDDGSQGAIVGSANLTSQGTALNAEAAIVLDTRDGDTPALLNDVAEAIDRWTELDEQDGAHHFSNADQIAELEEIGVLITPHYEDIFARPSDDEGGAGVRGNGLPKVRRRRHWSSRIDRRTRDTTAGSSGIIVPEEELPPIVCRWSKKLPRTDACQNAQHVIGELRLTQARLGIDPKRFFRDVMFGDEDWEQKIITVAGRDRQIEETHVDFNIYFPDFDPSVQRLRIVHMPHREFGQSNYVTAIKWGHALIGNLRDAPGDKGYTDRWVVLERYVDASYAIRIADEKPSPALIQP